MPFGMKAVEAKNGKYELKEIDISVTNAFRHEGR